MAKYEVWKVVTAKFRMEVEANSEEDAVDFAVENDWEFYTEDDTIEVYLIEDTE